MAKNKSSSNNSGCVTLIAGVLVFGVIGAIVITVLNILFCVLIGVTTSLPFIIIILMSWFVWKVIFYMTHRKPLTYEQARLLAQRNAQEYVRHNYKFKIGPVRVDSIFKSNLDVQGRWYEIEEPLDTFPAYIAALLEGKHHEWVIIAIEKGGLVCSMWANKGEDNQSVSFNCDINDIIQKCRQVEGYTILRFHNHPNPDPKHYTTLLASEQDKISAKSCAEYVCKEGFNWYDFVCARGKFIQFYSKISDTFEIRGGSTSDIVDKIGICPEMDYKFQKQYHKLSGINNVIKKKPIIVVILISLVVFYFVGNHVLNGEERNALAITNISEEMFYNPSEAYIEKILDEVPGIIEIEAVRPATDVNHLLEDECSSVIYFTYEKVDQTLFDDNENMPTAKGCDGGGCIEVFLDLDNAKFRMSTLKMMRIFVGKSYRYGTVIIRTSSKLPSSEQNELISLILNQMVQNPYNDIEARF